MFNRSIDLIVKKDFCTYNQILINFHATIQQQAVAANINNEDLILNNLLKEKFYQIIFDFKKIDDLHVKLFLFFFFIYLFSILIGHNCYELL